MSNLVHLRRQMYRVLWLCTISNGRRERLLYWFGLQSFCDRSLCYWSSLMEHWYCAFFMSLIHTKSSAAQVLANFYLQDIGERQQLVDVTGQVGPSGCRRRLRHIRVGGTNKDMPQLQHFTGRRACIMHGSLGESHVSCIPAQPARYQMPLHHPALWMASMVVVHNLHT
jgi:hypothetical protein